MRHARGQLADGRQLLRLQQLPVRVLQLADDALVLPQRRLQLLRAPLHQPLQGQGGAQEPEVRLLGVHVPLDLVHQDLDHRVQALDLGLEAS